jgi:hypothetical protein
MKKIVMSAVALTAMMSAPSALSADDGINVLDNLVFDAQIRPRYETVDDSTLAAGPGSSKKFSNADALTVRTKLKVTANLFGLDGLVASVGLISVNNFGSDQYNWNGSENYDGLKKYATVMDPQKAMLSNAEVSYTLGKTTLHAGRGQVNLDNQRFIGTVGWRQLERSYDTVYIADNSVKNLSVLAAWVYGYQGVFDLPTVDTNSVLLHAAYKVADPLTITAYDYMLANIHDTYGLALTGKIKMDSIALNYRAEYAKQGNASMKIHGGVPSAIPGQLTNAKADADYYNLDFGANIYGVLAGIDYEVLSGAKATGTSTAFSTPLATGHKFNGWADKFLKTPAGGLQDANIRVGYKAKGFGKILAIYHDFKTDTNIMNDVNGLSANDLGSEIDVVYANKIPGLKGLSGLLKYADFSKGNVVRYNADKQVFWAQLDYKFSTK